MSRAAVLVPLTCKRCNAPFTRKAWELKQAGRGQFCSAVCSNAARRKTGGWAAPVSPPKPTPTQRPVPVSPRADDLPLTDGGAFVRCAGPCGQLRERGKLCSRCEWRAFQEVAS